MREVKCLSSAVASVGPGRTGSQLCLERRRKTKQGAQASGFGVGSEGGIAFGESEASKIAVKPRES